MRKANLAVYMDRTWPGATAEQVVLLLNLPQYSLRAISLMSLICT